MKKQQHDVTDLLNNVSADRENSAEKLLEAVYADLRRLAAKYMQNERGDHTLQATALVHEAYMRLVDWENVSWQNRAQFFAVAAHVMRKILIDHARRKNADKRGGQKIALDENVSFSDEKEYDILSLEEALQSLEHLDKRQAKIVELRFFGGLTIEETAEVLNISAATVKREWQIAKLFLHHELSI